MPTVISVTVDDGMARVFVTVTGATGTTGEIVRVDSAGTESAIRGADPVTWQGGGFSGYDYEIPLDVPVRYRVKDATGAVLATSASVTVDSGGDVWLKNPGRPDLNMKITVQDFPQMTSDLPQGVFNVIGSKFPVVVSSERWAEQGDLTVRTSTIAEMQTLQDSLDLGTTLLLQTPADWGFGAEYVAVGQVTKTRLLAYGPEPRRVWTLPLTVVQAPVGLASAGVGNAWSDVVTAYATWTAVAAAKDSWTALIQRVAAD